MLQIHPNARTTPATRAEICRSTEPSGTLAKHYGVSAETIRKWRKRGPFDCQDHSARPRRLPWKATDEERAVVCALRQSTNFALDDLTFVVTHFLPHLNRDSIWRILRSEGLSRRRLSVSTQPARGQGAFRDYDLGFIHIDIKHLPKLQTADGERRKRYLYVAIDRRSRSVHLAVKDDETEKSATTADAPSFAATVLGMADTIGLPETVLADTGFASGPAVAELQAHGIEPLVAIGRTQPHRPYDFRPPPQAKPPRAITEPWRVAMKAKRETDDGKNRYKRRKQTVEPVFGIIKSAMGFVRFHLRGLANVATEWTSTTLAYNCRRINRLQRT